MSFDTIVMWIMASGALLGAVDKVLGNRFGLGDEFKKGYETMGPLTMGMVGIVCLTPLIQKGINSTIAPLFTAIGVDSAFLGAILANDMGGYQLSMELAADPRAGEIAGLLVASTLGATLVFNIPVGLGIIKKEQQPDFVRGLLVGVIAIPFGSFFGGLSAGFPLALVAANIAPVAVISILLAVGLKFIPRQMTRGCLIFGYLVSAAGCVGLACAGFESITGTEEACKYRQELTSTGDVIATVSQNPDAIGYASLAALKDTVKAVSVDGVTASEATVKDGTYKVQRPFVLVTKEGTELSDTAQKFFDYATSADAAEVISAAGAVSAN